MDKYCRFFISQIITMYQKMGENVKFDITYLYNDFNPKKPYVAKNYRLYKAVKVSNKKNLEYEIKKTIQYFKSKTLTKDLNEFYKNLKQEYKEYINGE